MKLSILVLVGLVLGLLAGTIASASASPVVLFLLDALVPVGAIWTNAIRMTVVPLVVAMIVTGVAGPASRGAVGRLGRRIIPAFILLLLAGGFLAILIGIPAIRALPISVEAAERMRESTRLPADTPPPVVPSLAQRLVEVVPVNPVKAAADAAMLPLVVFTLLFSVALARLPDSQRTPILSFFGATKSTMLELARWVLILAPVGIFALAVGLGARTEGHAAPAIFYYVFVLCGVLIAFTLLLYPLVRVLTGVPIRKFAAAAMPAQGIALGTRSSLMAVPALLAGAISHLRPPISVTSFAIPLAVAIFRVNVPIAWVIGVVFLGDLYGVPLDAMELVFLVFTATFLSFSVPGIPSASLFLLAPVLAGLGIPVEGVALLIAVDVIPDMFKTTVNVTAHMAVAAYLTSVTPPDPAGADVPQLSSPADALSAS